MCICGGRSLKTSVVRIQWKSGLERSPYSWRPERTFSKLGKRTWFPPAGLGPIGGTRGLCVMAARPPSLTLPARGPVPSRPDPHAPATCPHPGTQPWPPPAHCGPQPWAGIPQDSSPCCSPAHPCLGCGVERFLQGGQKFLSETAPIICLLNKLKLGREKMCGWTNLRPSLGLLVVGLESPIKELQFGA